MLSDSIIDQRRLTQARIDALFAGKISTEAFLRTRKAPEASNTGSDPREPGGPSCVDHAESRTAF